METLIENYNQDKIDVNERQTVIVDNALTAETDELNPAFNGDPVPPLDPDEQDDLLEDDGLDGDNLDEEDINEPDDSELDVDLDDDFNLNDDEDDDLSLNIDDDY